MQDYGMRCLSRSRSLKEGGIEMTEEQAYKKLSRILDIYEKIPARDYGGVDGGDKKLGRLLDKAF